MDVGVLLHVGLLVEALATVGARIRTCVAVDEQMRGQGAGALEGLAALFALRKRESEKTVVTFRIPKITINKTPVRSLDPFSFRNYRLQKKTTHHPLAYPLLIITRTHNGAARGQTITGTRPHYVNHKQIPKHVR